MMPLHVTMADGHEEIKRIKAAKADTLYSRRHGKVHVMKLCAQRVQQTLPTGIRAPGLLSCEQRASSWSLWSPNSLGVLDFLSYWVNPSTHFKKSKRTNNLPQCYSLFSWVRPGHPSTSISSINHSSSMLTRPSKLPNPFYKLAACAGSCSWQAWWAGRWKPQITNLERRNPHRFMRSYLMDQTLCYAFNMPQPKWIVHFFGPHWWPACSEPGLIAKSWVFFANLQMVFS